MATVLEEEPIVVQAPLPDLFEVIDGEIVECSPTSDYASAVATRLVRKLGTFLDENDIGECGTERLFRIPTKRDPSRSRRPDVYFLSYARWSADRPFSFTGNSRDVVPELLVEVASPSNSGDDLVSKAREYLRAGAMLVWIIYPEVREVHAYPPGGQIRVFLPEHELEAPDFLPGFRVNVASLFPPATDVPEPTDDV